MESIQIQNSRKTLEINNIYLSDKITDSKNILAGHFRKLSIIMTDVMLDPAGY